MLNTKEHNEVIPKAKSQIATVAVAVDSYTSMQVIMP